MGDKKTLHVVELRAENFKRLTAVQIPIGEGVTEITGRNAQGKSSVLDAVWAALGGKDACPSKPIREGEKSATITLDLGDLVVTRKWTADDKTTLTVTSKEGAKFSSPQAMLDKLVGQMSFDPLAFGRLEPKQQGETLRKLAGLDFTAHAAARAQKYAERTEINRTAQNLAGQLAGMPDPGPDAPDEPQSLAELAAKLKASRLTIKANAEAKLALQRMEIESTDLVDSIAGLKREIERKEAQLADLRPKLAAEHERCAKLVDPNVDEIEQEIEQLETRNIAANRKQKRKEKAAELAAVKERADAITKAIDALDASKAEQLAAAKFPVEGLSVDDNGATFRGLPLEQASSAEQLRVGLAIAAALNPTLRVVLVRDGSLLDDDGLKLVAEWAQRESMQVLLERVGKGIGGVVIEDGGVAS